jgi:hypothetical protein
MSAATEAIVRAAPLAEYRGDPREFDLAAAVAHGRPLVIRGLVRDWPLVKLAQQSDTAFAQHLAALDNGTDVTTLRLPPEAAGIIGYTPDLAAFNYEHFKVPLTLGLRRLATYSQREHPPGLVIQSVPIRECLPNLLADHPSPLPDPAIEPRLWLGNRTTTPVHFDAQRNIACVVCGTRRFTLFPPEQLPNLYVGPLDFAPTGAAISLARLDRPDDPRYPRLRTALEHAQAADLHEGDAIYIPPLWWHHVEALEQLNALVNYWWSPADAAGHASAHGRAALFHGLLAFRALPPQERAAWRQLFDYYVFGEENPAAHIPASRRGVLGPVTAETVEQLKQAARLNL